MISRIPRKRGPGTGAKLASALAAAGGGYLKGREQKREYELKKQAAQNKDDMLSLRWQQAFDKADNDAKLLEIRQQQADTAEARAKTAQDLADLKATTDQLRIAIAQGNLDIATKLADSLMQFRNEMAGAATTNADANRKRADIAGDKENEPKGVGERKSAEWEAVFDPKNPPEQSPGAAFLTGSLKNVTSSFTPADPASVWLDTATQLLPRDVRDDPSVQTALQKYVKAYPGYFFEGTPKSDKGFWEKGMDTIGGLTHRKPKEPGLLDMLKGLQDSTVTAPR